MAYLLKTLSLFVVAGLLEIGGGYLVWQWLKAGKPVWYGILGAAMLASYGVVATLQPSSFARVYATYGGIFIFISLLWSIKFENFTPDKYDIIGSLIALFGVCVMYYGPRNISL